MQCISRADMIPALEVGAILEAGYAFWICFLDLCAETTDGEVHGAPCCSLQDSWLLHLPTACVWIGYVCKLE